MKLEKENIEFLNKKLQNEYSEGLKKVNKELDQFAYVISHDLKAPLRAIANLALWIEEDLGELMPAEIKKNMDLLRGRVHRMESLINGILEYSRAVRKNENIEIVDVKKLLTEIIDLISPPSTFHIEIKENIPTIKSEKIKLQQVFSNLINNAYKHNHNPSSGKIIIDYQNNENSHLFSVEDNGPGISSEYHEKVFQIFQTLEARDQIENTGVGLAIVKKIVEENGGKVWVESERGSGAKFIFTWKK